MTKTRQKPEDAGERTLDTSPAIEIPPTEPKPQQPQEDAQQAEEPTDERVIDLEPLDLSPQPEGKMRVYWVGFVRDMPGNIFFHAVAGVALARQTENVTSTPGETRSTVRTPQLGSKTHLTDEEVEKFAARIRRCVLRRLGPSLHVDGPDGQPMPDRYAIVSVPTPEEVEAYRKNGMPFRQFVPQPGDRPLTEFVYFVPSDYSIPHVDQGHPEPISVTGIRLAGPYYSPGSLSKNRDRSFLDQLRGGQRI